MQRLVEGSTLTEPARSIPLDPESGVVVAGAGPAGVAAAIAAARLGVPTTLIETHGALGGVWTSGALSWVIDAALKPGVMAEITHRLERIGGRGPDGSPDFSYDVEKMKLVLDTMCREAGVRVLLHTRLVGVHTEDRRVRAAITESKSGRIAYAAEAFVDATGDGDLSALAGCDFDIGHPDTGQVQPMSLMALLSGLSIGELHDVAIANDVVRAGEEVLTPAQRRGRSKRNLLRELERSGIRPSYTGVSLFKVYDDVFALMANHQYGVLPDDAFGIGQATTEARVEVYDIVERLRNLGGRWSRIRLINTAAQIGVREGRRIAGHYRVSRQDVLSGATHSDGVALVTFGFDVHSLTSDEGGYVSPSIGGIKSEARPYEIPLRALIARDVGGLLIAGRCLSGDFWAHSSYRVTGNAVATGEAAGVTAALSVIAGRDPTDLPWRDIAAELPYPQSHSS